MEGCHFFITLQFICICCLWSVGGEQSLFYYIFLLQSFDLTIQDSHSRLLVLKHYIICIFLIYSDSVQKMSTALFIQITLEYSENYTDKHQGKMFLNIENVFVS